MSQGVSVEGVSVHRGGLCPVGGNERAVHILLECTLVSL